MLKKTLISIASTAALIGAFAAPAYAASTFHLVVPLGARTKAPDPVEAITVSLASAALPKAKVNQTYSESLRPYLSVTGDAAFEPAAARWSLAEGTLPAGLALDEATGAVAGTPTAKTTSPASFTVLATYKGSDGLGVYTIEVEGEIFNVSKISTGSQHTCAITTAGALKCWGQNNYGQLGDNTQVDRTGPVQVVGLTSGVASVALGNYHTCAVTSAGVAKCWGLNSNGQLGDNSTTNRLTPVTVSGFPSGVTSLHVGHSHACAMTPEKTAKCWGYNYYGQLGNNRITDSKVPVDVSGLGSVKGLALGLTHTCAVTTDGAAKCWGANYYGQLGNNTNTNSMVAGSVSGLTSGVVAVAAGEAHSCAVLDTGAAKCWGQNNYGQVGDNSLINRWTPVSVSGLSTGVASISGGQNHSCALTKAGAVKCWGWGSYGQLGNSKVANSSVPVDVTGLNSGVVYLVSKNNHSCAMVDGVGAKCWGINTYGQLGSGNTTVTLAPISVQGIQ